MVLLASTPVLPPPTRFRLPQHCLASESIGAGSESISRINRVCQRILVHQRRIRVYWITGIRVYRGRISCCGSLRIRCMAAAAVHRRPRRPRHWRPQPLPAAELWNCCQRRLGCRSARGDLRAAGGQLNWTIAELPPEAKRSAGGSFGSVRRRGRVCPAQLQWKSN